VSRRRERALVVLPHAQLDILAIIEHLEEERASLGTVRFAAALKERLALLPSDCMWPVVVAKRAIRWAPMERPWEKYGIFFTVDDEEIRVRAVFHLARNVRRHLRGR
jgi:plasmid stabilization system protein ParE